MTMNNYSDLLEQQRTFYLAGHTKPVEFRKKQLQLLKQLLKDHEQEIIDAVYSDFKKPAFETFGTEIGLIINEINFAISNLDSWIKPQHVPGSLVNFPSRNYILKEPYGVALIISPWNYPVQLSLLPLVGAIAAGNTAIIKPSELTGATSDVLQKLIGEYFKQEYISVITGGVETSKALLALDVNYIFFTGSTKVGKIIMKTSAERLIPVTLELGGKSPCIVDETANLEISAKRIAWGKFVNAGQTCVAPDYLLIQESIREDFSHHLKKAIQELYGETPAKSPDFTRIINRTHFDRIASLIDPEKVIYGGETDAETNFISPTVLDNVSWDDDVMQDEIFGPLLPILTYTSLEDAVEQIRRAPRPLALYLFTANEGHERYILENVTFGGGAINDTIAQLGNHHLSFGGVGNSGFGSYHGKASFDCFSHQKSIMKKNFLLDIPLRYAPYDGKIKWLKTIFR